MKKKIITIDGPAASGKEKISKYISKKLKFKHLDSGILYRRLAFIFLNNKVDINNLNHIKENINKIKSFSFQKSKIIRTQEISNLASKIAVYNFVRLYINKLQHDFVTKNKYFRGFVIDGRDIGSVVFKSADIKLYVKVKAEIRAKRRYKQLIDAGEKSIYPKILEEIKLRDIKDKCRKNSPLIVPNGAVKIDNNGELKKALSKINRLVTKLS